MKNFIKTLMISILCVAMHMGLKAENESTKLKHMTAERPMRKKTHSVHAGRKKKVRFADVVTSSDGNFFANNNDILESKVEDAQEPKAAHEKFFVFDRTKKLILAAAAGVLSIGAIAFFISKYKSKAVN